ncbi:tyrosine-protein kinase shark-like [Centruroides sculpturatus]|uniref:tyrosine-protein kinase shark-like n=1 Tax=Centruroides sculpturatus TaxID=218467 RepID=UPI000C6E7D1B|nr:tyrosine-protein kinase shark-like [Centruroides sculpturatus]XP_023237516.1 tyrosine-protein kinase shark-like [Centruroides sculpturatus]XP_023237517.1 tyrosine-protein kinase shark-like [Centruroides sculpturatus]
MHPSETEDSNISPPITKSVSRISQDENISWYHGKITRDAAEHILKISGGEEGQFLVRESTTSPGDYVLSLIHDGQPIHYQIRRHGEDAFFNIDEGPIIHGLEVLINHYQEDAQGLSTKLSKMCKGQPPPHDTRRHGRTNLLHRATREGDVTVVGELLKSGYHNLDAKNHEGQTAVHLASIIGHDEILLMLLQAGANANILDSSGLTPLHYACQLCLPTTVKTLLEEGKANVQARASTNGWVAMHEVASRGYLDIMKILLTYHAPCHPRSDADETPYDLAERNGHINCTDYLDNYFPVIPKTSRSEWFHEGLDREKATKLLQKAGMQDGLFLVRKSTRKIGVHVLSMVFNSHIYNFEINKKEKFYFIDDGPYFESLEHVLDYYSKLADGLPTQLSIPLKSEIPNYPEEIDNIGQKTASNYDGYSCFAPNLIRRESLKIGLPIGEGEFGSVLKGKWTNFNNVQVDVAIKTLRDEQLQSGREEFIREVEVMVGLDHPCIVRLLGVCLGPPLMMVQELIPMGSVLDYLLDYPNEVEVDYDLKLWAAQIAHGMMYLESKRFVHRDLAARNILLATKQQVNIKNFFKKYKIV